jgi:hypothetical protein
MLSVRIVIEAYSAGAPTAKLPRVGSATEASNGTHGTPNITTGRLAPMTTTGQTDLWITKKEKGKDRNRQNNPI